MKHTRLADLPDLAVSHNDKIRKQVLVPYGQTANITNLSIARFPPGEIAYVHCHKDMSEVFLVQAGRAEIVIDGQLHPLSVGDCITVDAGEMHELRNTGTNILEVLCLGVLV